ncbi:phytanoyl-CoA dioxygenase family protein [Streptomyces sp. NPDC048560]|uniref:phytanoyl-CoA dioxygenase family protein n=1 Tax=Streptomyces sp. NPDC048560 TaxID=3155488 RepID=UPI00344266A0
MPLSPSIEDLAGELEERGVIQLDDLVSGPALDLMRRGCSDLIRRTEDMRYSTFGWQLESDGEGGGWAARAAGKECIPGKVRVVGMAHEHSPELAAVPEMINLNEGLVRPLHGVAGDFYNTYLWAKPSQVGSEKPWHQDALFLKEEFYEKYEDVYTIWIAVDDAREDNGCLQFLPGSHRERIAYKPDGIDQDDLFASPREPTLDIKRLWPELTPVTLPRRAGSAVLFGGFTAHTSAPNRTDDERRAVSYVYSLPRRDRGGAGAAR